MYWAKVSQNIDVLKSGWDVLIISGKRFFGKAFFDVRSYCISLVKTKAIQTWTLSPPASPVGNTFWCQCGECFARDRRQDCAEAVALIMSSAWRKFTQRRTTARSSCRSATVAVDLSLLVFACIFLQLLVLDGVERLFGHDQAPSKCLPQQQVSGNLLFFATCASLPRRWIGHSPLFVFFLQIFAVSGMQRWKSQSSHPTNVVEIPRSS